MSTILLRAIVVLSFMAIFVFPFLAVFRENEDWLVGTALSFLIIILLFLIGIFQY